ncbi:hypothetical protein OG730_43345 (plasmid) [Streptomyces sp. NBC_01298]|uniref:hypothetical protein n=1 Tax=Streptomyces sp. NBC_01298 TaxID=2903817 RepID=UPI002E12C0B2|nr:hypothetical protein OG730_43345 [Streptomyces sp. NBC_01298]
MSVRWVRLELTVRTFDSARFTPWVDRCRAAGLSSTTLARLSDTEDERRRLDDPNKQCSANIPERGAFHSCDPAGTIVAPNQDGTWGGMTANTSAIALNRTLGYADANRNREASAQAQAPVPA